MSLVHLHLIIVFQKNQQLLCETRIMAVPGKGNFDADVIFVGEAPGKNEDIHGEIGRASCRERV